MEKFIIKIVVYLVLIVIFPILFFTLLFEKDKVYIDDCGKVWRPKNKKGHVKIALLNYNDLFKVI